MAFLLFFSTAVLNAYSCISGRENMGLPVIFFSVFIADLASSSLILPGKNCPIVQFYFFDELQLSKYLLVTVGQKKSRLIKEVEWTKQVFYPKMGYG